MNNDRRKKITEAIGVLRSGLEAIETCKEEEQEAFDNSPESLQQGAQGQNMESNIETMDEAINGIEEALDKLGEI